MPSFILSANRQTLQWDPHIFQLGNGNILGLWSDLHPDPGADGFFGVYARAWGANLGGAGLSDVRINDQVRGDQMHASGVALANGGFAVIFDSDGPSAINGRDDAYTDAYIKFYNADGSQRGAARQLTPNSDDDYRTVDIVRLPNNQTITLVSRYESAGDYDLLAYRHDASGRQIGGPRLLVNDAEAYVSSLTGADYIWPSIAASVGGNYAVSWHERTSSGGGEGYGVWTQVFRADGSAVAPARLVAPNLGGRDSRDQSDSQITGRTAGGFALAWERDEAYLEPETDIYLRLLDGTGAGTGPTIMVNSDRRPGEQELHDVVDLGGGRTLVTYINQIPDAIDDLYDGGVLLGRVFGPGGRALTASFRISEGAPYEAMEGGNTIINHLGQIVATFQAELTYQFDDDVIITSRALVLPNVFGGAGNNRMQGTFVNDRLFGQAGNDMVTGNRGNDYLDGGVGHDTLQGGTGADRLVGGHGVDQLFGQQGADVFVFRTPADAGIGASRDTIHDFQRGQDRIDLSAMDARIGVPGQQDLTFSGQTAAANSVWFFRDGRDVVIRGDVNGDAVADFAIGLRNLAQLSASDFIF